MEVKGYPQSLLKNDVDHLNKYCCVKCQCILKNPYQNPCGHRYCKDCLEQINQEEPQSLCKACVEEDVVEEESVINFNGAHPDNAIKRELGTFEFKCQYGGCPWEGNYKNLDDHLQSCDFKLEHCPECDKFIPKNRMALHKTTRCDTIEVEEINCDFGCPFEMQVHDPSLLEKHMMDNVAPHLQMLNKKVTKFRKDVSQNQSTYEKSLLVFNNDLETLNGKITSHETELKHMHGQLLLKEERINQLLDKVDLLEKITYDGTLIWRIANFKELRRLAVNEHTKSLNSPVFYTNKFGYKLCARLYLNGDSIGKGTHISLFLVIMQGLYDALLEWPFKHQVLFELLDQSGSKNHISDSFIPDPSNNSFKRPTTEMNKATGFPLFYTLAMLEAQPNVYLKDDIIFIRISVDVKDTVNL